MNIKVNIRSSIFKEILDGRLERHGFKSELIDMDKPLAPQVPDAEILINGTGRIDKSIIDLCPKLLLVHQAGIGYDNIDVQYCTSKSIFVANVPIANAISVGEHTLFLMMTLAKNMYLTSETLMKRRNPAILGMELHGKTLLIVGLGSSGTEVAKRAKSFGMNIIAVTKDPVGYKPGREKLFFVDEVRSPAALCDCIPKADFISLHVPLTAETQGMIGTKELALMKKSAFLLNVARAPIVDREGLFAALKENRIAGAAFDVFWEEPASSEDKLLKLENFLLTPHIAGWTKESVEAIAEVITSNILRISQGSSPLTVVNSELLRR